MVCVNLSISNKLTSVTSQNLNCFEEKDKCNFNTVENLSKRVHLPLENDRELNKFVKSNTD